MLNNEGYNIKDFKAQATVLGNSHTSHYAIGVSPKLIHWFEENKEISSTSSYLVSYQGKFGLFAIFPYTEEFCDSDESRHSHVSRLSKAATQKFSSGNLLFCCGFNTGADCSDEFAVFIPYGLPVRGILTNIKTMMTQFDNEFFIAKQTADEIHTAFKTVHF